jgi:hypothetical protein
MPLIIISFSCNALFFNFILFMTQVKCIAARISIVSPQNLESVSFADLSGVMPQCTVVELEGHDNRASFAAWHEDRALLATW